MAKQRMINTRFWSDGYIRKMTIDDKLFYLYLLTNEHTDICGVYEIDKETMAFESGLTMDRLSKAMDSLSAARKILYHNGWIYIKNWKKYQLSNPKVEQGIKIGLSKVPPEFSQRIAAFDSLSIDYDSLSHSNPNPNPNPNSNFEEEAEKISATPTPADNMKDFCLMVTEKKDDYVLFCQKIAQSKKIPPEIVRRELDKFCNYWQEKTRDGKKERWQTEKTFEVQRRLATWFGNVSKYQPQQRQSIVSV